MARSDGRLSHDLMPGEKGPQDACGVFGVWAPGEDVAKMTYYGLYALQHRGQEACGIASVKDERFYTERHQGLVGEAFGGADLMTRMPGRASAMPSGETLTAFAATGATLAIHLAIHALDAIVNDLLPLYGEDCPVAVVVRASCPDERILRGTLGTIRARVAAEPIERTALVLVGQALAAHDFRESALYDPDYRRRFRGGR